MYENEHDVHPVNSVRLFKNVQNAQINGPFLWTQNAYAYILAEMTFVHGNFFHFTIYLSMKKKFFDYKQIMLELPLQNVWLASNKSF